MITVIYDRGGGGENVNIGRIFILRAGKLSGFYNINYNYKFQRPLLPDATGTTSTGNIGLIYNDGFIFRALTAYPSTSGQSIVEIRIDGNFNFDMLKIENDSGFSRRVEVRNDNGVLITDNGLPWGDGTYPPDAKNRAGLTGLHAAPIASLNEFADLSGLNPNKEEEITIGERGAGVQYALEKDEE